MTHLFVVGAVTPWISQWLTPIWLLGLGSLLGLVLLCLVWGVAAVLSRIPALGEFGDRPGTGMAYRLALPFLKLVSRRTVAEVPMAVREGVLWPLLMIAVGLAAFGIVGSLLVRDPLLILQSLGRLPYTGAFTKTYDIPLSAPVDPNDEFSDLKTHEIPVAFKATEIRRLDFLSNQNLTVAVRQFAETKPGGTLDVVADEPLSWANTGQSLNPFVEGDVEKLYVRNQGSAPAKVAVTVVTAPQHREVATILWTGVVLAICFLLYILQHAVSPRLSAIALSTYKSEVAQPLFGIIIVMGIVLLALFVFIPYNTFGEDIKMLKDSGLTLVMILGIVQAVWAASTSVAEEIEGRTALTVLSKPIGRRSFILGKLLGIVWTVTLLFAVLGLVLLLVVAYKPVYDAKESVTQDLTWQYCHREMIYTIPGLTLALMETVVLAAISVAISTRLPLLANFVICFAIYLLGHLTPAIVQSSMGQFVFVQFFGQLIATIFPTLDHFNTQAAVAAGLPVPSLYLGWAFVYCVIYSVIAMLLACVLFEDRDLA